MPKRYFVYILSSPNRQTLYIGSTSSLALRVSQHKDKLVDSFTSKYNCSELVYYEELSSAEEMVKRERQLKNWHRDWKTNLILEFNPKWEDLYESILH